MADDILKNIWNELSSTGKTNSEFDTWKTNVSESEDVQKNVYGYLKDKGYTESEFVDWQTNVLPVKTNDSASADPAVESNQSDMDSTSENGSSDFLSKTYGLIKKISPIYEMIEVAIQGGVDSSKAVKDSYSNEAAPDDPSKMYSIARGLKENPKGFFANALEGIPGALNTVAKIVVDDLLVDGREAVITTLMETSNYLDKGRSATKEEKEMIARSAKATNDYLDNIIALTSPQFTRKGVSKITEKLNEHITVHDNTISEEILKGSKADWGEVGGRIFSGALTSSPYTLAALNPYTAAALGLSISNDKFVEEYSKNPDKELWKVAGNAATTGGIEMIDSLISRRMFRAKGLLNSKNFKGNAEKALDEMNKGIGRKILDVIGIGGKESLTEMGQSIATKINDELWLGDSKNISEVYENSKSKIIEDAFEIIDEGIIGGFSGGGIAGIVSATRGNATLKARAEFLLMPASEREAQKELFKKIVEKNNQIKLAKEEGNQKKADVLQGLNNDLKKELQTISIKNQMVLDNLQGKDLMDYAKNVDKINILNEGKNSQDVENDINNLVSENQTIFDRVLKENFGENMAFTKAAAAQLNISEGLQILDNDSAYEQAIADSQNYKTFEEYIDAVYEKRVKETPGITRGDVKRSLKGSNGVFVGKGGILINSKQSKKMGAVGVGSHEVLHPILSALVGDAKAQKSIVQSFEKALSNEQATWVKKELKKQGKVEGTQEYYNEYLTVFSEGLVKNRINFERNVFGKIKDWVTKTFIDKGFDNIDFVSGRGVYNFMKSYSESIKSGKLSEKTTGAITKREKETGVKVSEAEAVSNEDQFSKTITEAEAALDEAMDADPNDPNYLDNIEKAEKELDEAEAAAKAPPTVVPELKKEVKPKEKIRRPEKPTRTTDLGPRDPLSKKIMDAYDEGMEGVERTEYKGSKPLPASLERKLVPMFEGYINTIVQQKFKQFATEALEFQDALSILRAEVSSAIRTYNPKLNKDLAGYVKKIVQTRQSLMFKDANTEFSSDIDDAKGVVSTEDTQSIDRSGAVERGQATFDELDVVDNALTEDITTDLEKEIRVRTQKGTLSETVSIKKGRDTYIVSWLENYVNKQLFKKLSKKLGAIGEREGETVIPGPYIDFLNDPNTFDIVTKALPIKSIKKSYGKLFPTEKVGRELTAEGNPVFRIKPIDKKTFLTYFVKGKKSTILERQKQLFREILEPVAKQVIADYATPENLGQLKSIQELAPDTSLDVQAGIIIEAQLNDLQSQLDRYKGEKTGFDIIQFSKTVTTEEKQNISNALTPLLEKLSNTDFKYYVVQDILEGVKKVKDFEGLAKLVWNAGNDTLNKNSIRTYRAELLKLLANKLNYTDTVKFLISAINEYQTVYKYQQKVIGFDYSLANFKSSLNNVNGIEAKAYVAELFLRYISRSIRTLKLDGITRNEQVYDQILKPVLGDPKKYGFSKKIDREKNRSYILRDGVRLQGLADVTNIKADFINNVKTINEEAIEVRNWLLNEAIKAIHSKNKDSFIGFLSLISADQRGVIRKMNSAGFAMEGLAVKDSILEHETEAVEVFQAWKDFVEGKLDRTQLINFLEGAKVNLVSRELDTLLRKVQKERGERGKKRYTDQRVKDYLKNKKIIQFSKNSKADPIDTSIVSFSKTINEAKAMANRVDAPVKGISIWDFDDTLATTKSNVLYTLPGQTQVFHGGDIKSPKDIKGFAYFSEEKIQADAYSEENQGETRSFSIREQAIGNEDQVRRVIEELGIQPKDTDWKADESSLYELIDDRFEQAFSKKDMVKLADALKKKGIQAARFEDTNIASGINQGRYTENIVVFDKGAVSELNKINATEFALKADELAAKGATFDFSEFSKVMNGAKGPMFDKAVARNKKFGNENVYILTARPADSKYAIHEFLEGIGLDIELDNIFGLGDGTAIAKAKWVIGKVAEGYNDFYFADDAYKNVKAVQEVLEQSDVKSKVHQAKVQFSKSLNKEFNNIIEDTTGIDSKRIVSDAKGKVLGEKKGRFKFFIPPSADDFAGLLYNLTGKGKRGEAHQAWFKEALFDPFAKGIREFESYKQNATAIVNQLKKSIKKIPSGLNKVNSTGFTNEVAVRVYLWVKNGYEIPGLTAVDQKELIEIIANNPKLKDFANQMDTVLNGYPEPQNDWLAGTITTDAINMVNTTKRAEFLQEWQDNADVIFSKENINKLRASFGDNYVEALQDMLYRMKTGRNRPSGANKLTNKFMNWVNDSVGTIMFFNTRSALLQTLSIVNFINWHDNNPIQAAKAFANQKQFWSDFSMLFNSDFLKQRRSGLKNDVNADDIANAAETATNKTKAVFASLLKAGFLPTQIADSFAIAMGGASFIRNRINGYMSEGMTEADAKEKAFLDFQEIAEETQQSSRPDRISQQQASPLGRIILAFANTPMQYMRLSKKAFLDLKNGRGDVKTNVTKIIYYTAVQNIIFSSLQAALFAIAFDEDEDAEENKKIRVANSMLDSILRGLGVYGAIASTLKNIGAEVYSQSNKNRPDYTVAAQRALSISPPIDSKMRKIMSASRAFSYKTTREKMKGFGLDNPAFYAGGQIVSAGFNVPLDRVIKKADNIRVALDNETKMWQSIALMLGYSQWDLGLIESGKNGKSKKKGWHNVKRGSWNNAERGSWNKKK